MGGSHVMMIPGAWEPRRRSGAVLEPLPSTPGQPPLILRPFDTPRVVPGPVEERPAQDERRVEGPRPDAQRPKQIGRSKLIFAAALVIAAAIVYLLVIR
jgi:hypothetical protein